MINVPQNLIHSFGTSTYSISLKDFRFVLWASLISCSLCRGSWHHFRTGFLWIHWQRLGKDPRLCWASGGEYVHLTQWCSRSHHPLQLSHRRDHVSEQFLQEVRYSFEISRMPFQEGSGTNTTGALRLVLNDIYKQEHGDRLHVRDITIVLTDGQSTIERDLTVETAKKCMTRASGHLPLVWGHQSYQSSRMKLGALHQIQMKTMFLNLSTLGSWMTLKILLFGEHAERLPLVSSSIPNCHSGFLRKQHRERRGELVHHIPIILFCLI